MSPLHDIGRILSQVYVQNQSQVEAQPPDVPRLAGGLWAAFKFEDAAAKYKQHLHDHYGFLHILGHNRPVPLEGVFTDVYLYDRPLAQRRLDVAQLEEQFRQRHPEQPGAKRVDGLFLVKTEARLFILGQPGAGKTTFLKHVALQAAKSDLPGIPIFISLKALADSQKPLLDFMALEMQICGFPEPLPFLQLMLHSGQMLILLDGLDEVTQAQETALNLIQGIENLIRQYSGNHFLLTCRTAVTDYQFPGFTTVQMADFNLEQVAVFVRKWFKHEPTRGETCLRELNQPEQQGLRDLARTPLFLNLLCLTFSETGRFPRRQVDLYEEGIEILLNKWDRSRRIQREDLYRQLSLSRKMQLLSHIAASTFQKGQYLIPKAELLRYIRSYFQTIFESTILGEVDAEAVIRTIEAQHGILVEHANRVYGFAHLTFHEYFAAKYFAETDERTWIDLIVHYTEPQWREVFLLTTSLLQEADDFFHRFITELYQSVTQDSQLLALLTWASQKANHGDVVAGLPHHALYIYLARALALALDRALTFARVFDFIFDRDRALDFALALALDFAFDRDFAFDLADALDRALHRALDRDFDRVLDLDLDFDLDHAVDRAADLTLALDLDLDALIVLDFAFVYGRLFGRYGLARPFIDLAQELSRAQGLVSLQKALDSLVIPAKDASKQEHQQCAEAIWQIAQQERQLQEFELNEEHVLALTTYLEGTQLLIQCLKLATVTDRDAILSRLLVPPPEQSA